MKTNSNNRSENTNSRYTRKAVENLKAMIKANDIEELTLAVYGIQIYASYVTGEEYTVVIKAERDIKTGRYYFITREGDRIAWSRLDIDTLIHAAVDFMDRVEELEKQAAREVENLEKYESTVIDSDLFFYYVRHILNILDINWHFTGHYWTNDGRTTDAVRIERPATRKPSEPVRHWLHTRPTAELADMKADRIRKADALHKAGHYAAAVYASQLCGMIDDEQTARRADDIEKASEATKADRMTDTHAPTKGEGDKATEKPTDSETAAAPTAIKYRVITTANGHENGHNYDNRETAEQTYNNIRATYRRSGYTIADAGGQDIESGLCELWTKDGMPNRNIEIYAVH